MSESIRVLLVENESESTRTIWEMLQQKSQFQIEAVVGLPAALTRLSQQDIDVVLLDLSPEPQPVENEAVARIHEAHPRIALLVVTRHESEEAGLRALELGAEDYLLKRELGTYALVRALHYAVERKRAEAVLRDNDKRQSYLLKLADALRSLDDPVQIQDAVARTLMNFYNADRCYYCEINKDTAIIRRDAARARLPPVTGVYPLRSMPIFKGMVETGQPVIVSSVYTAETVDEVLRQIYVQMQVIAYIDIPVIKSGQLVGVLCVSQSTPRSWTALEIEMAVETAERTWAAVERAQAEAALRESEARLAAELADTRQLQRISSSLIKEDDINALYNQILDAAHALMHSDMASIQRLVPERNQLFLLSHIGFNPESAAFWEWVESDDTTSSGLALKHGETVIVPDVEIWGFVAGTEDLKHYHRCGIRSMVSIPLIARDGRFVGVISTHWRKVHQPSERELWLLDVVARQAADLLQQRAAEEALRATESKYRAQLEADIRQRTAELKTAQESLQATLDSSLIVIQAFKAVRDEAGKIIDFLWVMNNTRAIEQNGEVIGKSLLEQNPGVVPLGLFDKFVEVVETGVSIDHEQFYDYEQFNGWFHQILVKMGDGFVMNTEDITDRKNTEHEILRLKDELAQSAEQKYRSLFEMMGQGYSLNEMIRDSSGQAVDFVLWELNPAFEQIIGLPVERARGQRAYEVLPDLEDWWIKTYDRVLREGKSARLEYEFQEIGRWFQLWIYPRENNQFVVLSDDITDRKRREAAEHEERLLAEGMRDTALALSSALTIDEVLESALASAQRLIALDVASVILVEAGKLTYIRTTGLSKRETTTFEGVYRKQTDVNSLPLYQQAADSRVPVLITAEAHQQLRLSKAFGHTVLVMPLWSEEVVIGYFTLINRQPRSFTETDLPKLQALTYQVVTAVKSAERSQQAQELAVLQERHNIARDLHDAVTQTLFSASVLTETLVKQLQQPNAPSIQKILPTVQRLIQSALAEMRTLLLELRPAHVNNTPVNQLLRQITQAALGRKNFEIDLTLGSEPRLPPDVHLAVYRITQEAVNNIIKHANASRIWITSEGGTDYIDLRIRDNGSGFDVRQSVDGMGMGNMRERAREVNAEFAIRSTSGAGTEIHIVWPKAV